MLALGLYLRTYGHAATSSQGWLLGRSVWSYADFLVTSLVFTILGYELVKVLDRTNVSRHSIALATIVVLVLVVVRFSWVFAGSWVGRQRSRRRDEMWPQGWRESAVVSWAGMRGVVTVAATLALPELVDGGVPFPNRDQIVVVALVVVLTTLVLQGLTLAPLTRRLGVGRADDDSAEVAGLRRRATEAALEHLHGDALNGVLDDVSRAALLQYDGYLAAQEAMTQARQLGDGEESGRDQLRSVLERATDVERALVLDARRRGQVSPASADEVLRDIEARALRAFE